MIKVSTLTKRYSALVAYASAPSADTCSAAACASVMQRPGRRTQLVDPSKT